MRGRKVSGLTAVYSRNENLSKYARRGKVRFSSSSSSSPDNLCRYRGHYVRKFSRPTFSLLLSHSVYLTLCICRTIVIYTKIIVKLGGKELWRTIFLKIGQNLNFVLPIIFHRAKIEEANLCENSEGKRGIGSVSLSRMNFTFEN